MCWRALMLWTLCPWMNVPVGWIEWFCHVHRPLHGELWKPSWNKLSVEARLWAAGLENVSLPLRLYILQCLFLPRHLAAFTRYFNGRISRNLFVCTTGNSWLRESCWVDWLIASLDLGVCNTNKKWWQCLLQVIPYVYLSMMLLSLRSSFWSPPVSSVQASAGLSQPCSSAEKQSSHVLLTRQFPKWEHLCALTEEAKFTLHLVRWLHPTAGKKSCWRGWESMAM